MIRVTLNNKEIIESKILINESWYISLDKADYRKTEIVKIEKQVKNLTLEECRKLSIHIVELRSDGYWVVNEITHEYKPYYDDTYIDITSLVVGK